MRILHVVPSFGLGGMEKIICTVINHAAANHRHGILALDGCTSALTWISNPWVESIPFRKSSSRYSFFLSLFTSLHRAQPQLLMTYNWGATDAIWLGRLAKISKIIHHEHGFNAEEGVSTTVGRDMIRSIVYRLTSQIIVVSHELEGMLDKKFRISKSRVVRIPNGIDVARYSPNRDEGLQVRRSLGYRDSDLVLGFAGRLDPVKNLDLLLDVFEGCIPSLKPFRLLIVGDGPDKQRLETRCRANGIDSYVKFLGQQSEVLPYLRAMDVFLLTSMREQMPLTVLEAMAVGIPVVATRVGEIPFIVEDGVDGFIRSLNAAVGQFVEPLHLLLNASLRTKMGEAARKKAMSHFGIERMLARYSSLIDEYSVAQASRGRKPQLG